MAGSVPAGSMAAVPAPSDRVGPPRTVVGAAAVASVEGLALVAVAVLLIVKTVVGTPTSLVDALGGALLALVGAACLIGLSSYVVRLRRWARTPIVVLQVLWLPIGFSLAFQGGLAQYGVPILVASLIVLGLFATPEARAAFL